MFTVIAPLNAPPQTRRAHTKSRTGCLTCKARRLKCDEVKPLCGGCKRHFVNLLRCDFPSTTGPEDIPSNQADPAGSSLRKAAQVSPQPIRKVTRTTKIARVTQYGGREEISSDRASSTSDISASWTIVQRGAPNEEPEGPNPSTTPIEQACSNTDEQGESWEWQSSLPYPINNELLDPFKTYPTSQVKGVDHLMKYYLQTAVYSHFPWQPPSPTNPTTTFLIPLILSDSLLFNTTLQFSALRFLSRGKQCQRINQHQLQRESISLLRQRISDTNMSSRVSDQTISAVATLAAIEHEQGNLKMLKMHLSGLQHMIRMRGGLDVIRQTNAMVANAVFWIFVVAIYELPYPSFDPILPPFIPQDHGLSSTPSPPPPPPTTAILSHFSDLSPSSSSTTTTTKPSTAYTSLSLLQPIASILNSVQHVSELVPTHSAYASASTSLKILTRLCTLLSHLLSLPPLWMLVDHQSLVESTPEIQFTIQISEATRFAILLHIFTPWKGLPPSGTLTINHLLHKLISSLRLLLANPLTQQNILILWIFSAGGIAAGDTPERTWFVSHLREMTREMGISTWEEMKGYLSSGIWHEALCEGPYRMLWEEVVASREMEV